MGASTAALPQVGAALPRLPWLRREQKMTAIATVEENITFDAATYFRDELDSEIYQLEQDTGFPESQWFRAGAKGSQDREWWYANGPRMCEDFLDWYDSQDDVSVWITPDGRPAIELELNVKFGDVPVHMFVDLVLQMGSALVVVDLKSGAKVPDSPSQLAIYASGIELEFGKKHRPRYGSFYMLRGVGRDEPKDFFLSPVELGGYQQSVEWWTRQFAMLDRAVESGVFIANPGEHCKRCGVAGACPAVGGKDAWRHDQDVLNFEYAREAFNIDG